MNTVLVTGANGFIGRRLCATLLASGVGVRATVRNRAAIKSLPDGTDPHVTGDIESCNDWKRLLIGIAGVVHLAGRAHIVRDTAVNPLDAFRRANVLTTEVLLRACREAHVDRFVLLSSIMAVGRGGDHAYVETDQCQPEDDYGRSKLEAERLVAAMGNNTPLETVVLRPPLVYGPGVGGNFERLMNLVRRGVPLPLGQIANARSMIYLDNLIDAILLALSHPNAAGETFHVCDEPAISTPELVRRIAASLNRTPRLLPVPQTMLRAAGRLIGRHRDVERLTRSLCVSNNWIRSCLKWSPRVPQDVAIRRTVTQSEIGVIPSQPFFKRAAA